MKKALNMMSQIQKGFTLIELMISVAIIGIITSIAYPSYQGFTVRTNRALPKLICVTRLQQTPGNRLFSTNTHHQQNFMATVSMICILVRQVVVPILSRLDLYREPDKLRMETLHFLVMDDARGMQTIMAVLVQLSIAGVVRTCVFTDEHV